MGSCRGPDSSLTGVCAKGDEDTGHTEGPARGRPRAPEEGAGRPQESQPCTVFVPDCSLRI